MSLAINNVKQDHAKGYFATPFNCFLRFKFILKDSAYSAKFHILDYYYYYFLNVQVHFFVTVRDRVPYGRGRTAAGD